MDANALKTLQAPLKERYREKPEAAVVTLKAEGKSETVNVGLTTIGAESAVTFVTTSTNPKRPMAVRN